MAAAFQYFLLILAFLNTCASQPVCVPGCTCSEESFGRALLCVSISLGKIPGNLPEEFKQVRIENSPLFELSRDSFSNVSTLEYLWLNFNNVTVIHSEALDHLQELRELRLEGNKLQSVPWTAFRATPLLKVLDLKHNRIDVLPEQALQFLGNLTYLDLSSNRLTVVSSSVFVNWMTYQKHWHPACGDSILSSMVLALHNNPWECDCRLRGLIQFVKSISFPIILVNSYLICQGPLSKAGQLFHETEPSVCMKPKISTPSANFSIQAGQNVTLRCLAKASPSPTIVWSYPLSMWREFSVLTSSAAEDAVLSELVIPTAQPLDSGNYTCVASNALGRSTLAIPLHVQLAWEPPAASAPSTSHVELRVAQHTAHGVLLEWLAVARTPKEQGFTLRIASDEASRKEVVHLGPGIHSYAVDDLLPGTKYEACLSPGSHSPRPRQGPCVVFVTGSVSGAPEGRECLLHATVVLCAVLLVVPVGAYVWAAQGACSWCQNCCPHRRRPPRCPRARPPCKNGSFRDHIAVYEDGQGPTELQGDGEDHS
ncbi:leucine-rich repeat, immunoglobulin-like domain and transmembrane domain-containing protein 2 [Octodon degus]|uniref:leucine-rich repeat, immunoglobulin-like domain and transmembrane domain-containing protein 2 n=1 Tax=Octodon degus TaxID=10160 RepID=UPI0003338B26|nr:leucine-rich repeat, immunoglobulin-like domain and transmembrane domain-containing protein 2 [Octodon degus]